MTGGNHREFWASTTSVHRFDIAKNKWEDMPDFNIRRLEHSSCALGTKLYIFMGKNEYSYLNSIEHLETKKVFASKPATWKLLEIEGEACDTIPYCNIGITSLNNHEIVIIGGYRHGQVYVGDVHLFNTDTGDIENVI